LRIYPLPGDSNFPEFPSFFGFSPECWFGHFRVGLTENDSFFSVAFFFRISPRGGMAPNLQDPSRRFIRPWDGLEKEKRPLPQAPCFASLVCRRFCFFPSVRSFRPLWAGGRSYTLREIYPGQFPLLELFPGYLLLKERTARELSLKPATKVHSYPRLSSPGRVLWDLSLDATDTSAP